MRGNFIRVTIISIAVAVGCLECLVGIYFQIYNYFQVSCAHANNCLVLFLCPSKQSHAIHVYSMLYTHILYVVKRTRGERQNWIGMIVL